jgi:hypothetical protein
MKRNLKNHFCLVQMYVEFDNKSNELWENMRTFKRHTLQQKNGLLFQSRSILK